MKIFGKIPVSMSPSFWVVAALIGYFNTNNIMGTLIWIAVIFVSVLVHELGHATVAYQMGAAPRIEFIAFGGLTHYLGGNLSLGRQFFIVLAGPVCGFLLFLGAFFLNSFGFFHHVFILQFLSLLQVVNLFWTAVNFIPVLPLDGGQMLRIGLEACFKSRGRYYALLVSVVIASIACAFFFFYEMLLFGAFFFLFAYQSYMDFKKEKHFLPQDLQGDLQQKFSKAEEALRLGRKEEASEGFRAVLRSSSQGTIANFSSQYLAFLEYEKGEKAKAFELLLSSRKHLSGESLYLLHKLAFELGQYALVIELSGSCFQSFPLPDVSERAAKAHAEQKQVEACLGWLETSLDLGGNRSLALVSDTIFDSIRERPAFAKWVKSRLA